MEEDCIFVFCHLFYFYDNLWKLWGSQSGFTLCTIDSTLKKQNLLSILKSKNYIYKGFKKTKTGPILQFAPHNSSWTKRIFSSAIYQLLLGFSIQKKNKCKQLPLSPSSWWNQGGRVLALGENSILEAEKHVF